MCEGLFTSAGSAEATSGCIIQGKAKFKNLLFNKTCVGSFFARAAPLCEVSSFDQTVARWL
jgi:hypothetical protein